MAKRARKKKQAFTAAHHPELTPPLFPGDRARASLSLHPENVVLCCLKGFDNFVDDLIAAMKPDVEMIKVVSNNMEEYAAALADRDTVWLEWGNQLAEAFTRRTPRLLDGKRVILRIHSYEVLDGLADRIDFTLVDDLVFVAPHIRDILLTRRPDIGSLVKRIHVIPNGVDCGAFAPIEREPGHNVAFLGTVDFKKDPMVLMHAFQSLHRRDARCHLHIGGASGHLRYRVSMPHFVRNNGLEGAVTFHGRVLDVPAWLRPMHFIICTSLMEGHPVGLLEAMATGCRPLIYNWPGAEAFYPREYLWNNHDELRQRMTDGPDPAGVRAFVQSNYSVSRQAEAVKRMLLDGTTEVFPGFVEGPK